jgi:hypothetical protein
MPPASDLTSVRIVHVDGKGFSPWIKMEIPVVTPLGDHRPIGDFYALQDATELLLLSVKDPGAVARFQDDGVHDAMMVQRAESQRGGTWKRAEDRIAVG